MNNMQDASSQLMRPPRELASWNFPLSNILEEYFNLLPEPCKISFGEAAFIIQNSVNAYVRRVEELYDETKCFSNKIVVEEEEAEKNNQKEKKLKKNLIDLSQFERISFSKDIGKNINLKRHEQKPIKYLHQCFSQLESSHSGLNIKVFDNQGEIIGKKYDFRCNQHMNKNGTLVEEFTSKDFESFHEQESTNQEFSADRDKMQSLSDSNFLSADEADSVIDNPVELAEKSPESFEPNNDEDNIVRYDQSSDDEVFMDCSTLADSGITDSSVIDCQENNESSVDDPQENNREDLVVDSQKLDNTTSVIDPKENSGEKLTDKTHNPTTLLAYSETNNLQEGDQTCNAEVHSENTLKNVGKESDELENNLKRSKRLKRKLEETNKSNKDSPNLMHPIPFENGIPEKLEKARKEFKLPCHIALLKSVPKRHYRSKKNMKKINPSKKVKMHEQPTEECTLENLDSLKCQMYSPSGPLLNTKEENPNGFRRNLNESFGIRPSFTPQYQPITTLTMDLLGFAANEPKTDLPSEEEPDSLSDYRSLSPPSRSPLCTSPSRSSPENSFPPHLPFLGEVTQPFMTTTPQKEENTRARSSLKSCQKYNKLVKCKIEEIYKELDLQTDEDQKVAKWHEEIKPRLKEAELKPPFCIHDYESKIKKKLKTSHKKLSFDDIVREEPPCEIARYFSATLQLASTNNLNINSSKNPQKSIELILID